MGNAIGGGDKNAVSIKKIKESSVNVTGNTAPLSSAGSTQAAADFITFQNLLMQGNFIANMQIGKVTVF